MQVKISQSHDNDARLLSGFVSRLLPPPLPSYSAYIRWAPKRVLFNSTFSVFAPWKSKIKQKPWLPHSTGIVVEANSYKLNVKPSRGLLARIGTFLFGFLPSSTGNPDLKKRIYWILLFSYCNPHNILNMGSMDSRSLLWWTLLCGSYCKDKLLNI